MENGVGRMQNHSSMTSPRALAEEIVALSEAGRYPVRLYPDPVRLTLSAAPVVARAYLSLVPVVEGVAHALEVMAWGHPGDENPKAEQLCLEFAKDLWAAVGEEAGRE